MLFRERGNIIFKGILGFEICFYYFLFNMFNCILDKFCDQLSKYQFLFMNSVDIDYLKFIIKYNFLGQGVFIEIDRDNMFKILLILVCVILFLLVKYLVRILVFIYKLSNINF